LKRTSAHPEGGRQPKQSATVYRCARREEIAMESAMVIVWIVMRAV
jgi:hypothetical protein